MALIKISTIVLLIAVAFLLGTFIGMILMALMVAGKKDEERSDEEAM